MKTTRATPSIAIRPAAKQPGWKGFALTAALLGIILAALFFRSFSPDEIIFSNDGPLGGMQASQNRVPAIITGLWQDLNWLGSQSPAPSPTISLLMRLITTPVGYSKVFCPATLLILGVCAWFCFRQWKLSPLACTLGAIAAALSSHFFSTAAWGVAAQCIAIGMNFVAIGLLSNTQGRLGWVRVMVAGMAVGMGVMEGYDVGAIFSLFVAAFVVYQALISQGATGNKIAGGLMRVGLVAIFAAFIAVHALTVLIGTQVKGVAGMEQDAATKARRWDEATQWSFPKSELLRIAIPGLFGYRMDTPKDMAVFSSWFEGGAYWGKVGETPGWSDHHNDPEWVRSHGGGGYPRFSGGGEYAGLLVLAIAVWASAQALRKKDSVFSPIQQRMIWFWMGAAGVSLLLAFGRYAPFYQFVYMLPYFSTIRNPAKFLHPFHWCLVILFAYGVHGLCKRYLEKSAAISTLGLSAHLKQWWARAESFEKKWTTRSVLVILASLVGWLIYAASRPSLVKHLQDVGFGDPALANQMAGFSISEVGWFILFLVLTLGLLTLVLSGRFAGAQARKAGILLGALLVIDLARANLPWIIYWNYPEKYASNPVIERLRERPYEQRIAMFPLERYLRLDRLPPEAKSIIEAYQQLNGLYRIEWMQHLFQYYDIQCLEVIQLPRAPLDYLAYETALSTMPLRHWELTNTRYLLGPAAMLEPLNQQIDPGQKRFRILTQFEIVPKPGVINPTSYEELTAVESTNGPCALFEFTGALPRAKLYANWQTSTNDQATLERLLDPKFPFEQTVLLADALPSPNSAGAANSAAGSVEITGYAPKHLRLRANAQVPSVLLLNDHYDPNWKVRVDDKPATLLRCNYIMQGVQLPAGTHQIELKFTPPLTSLYVSIAAIAVWLGLIGVLGLARRPKEARVEKSPAAMTPA